MDTPITIKDANNCRVDSLKRHLHHYDIDFKKEKRLELHQCKYCAYLEISDFQVNIDGAFTCIMCLEEVFDKPLHTSKICMECATHKLLCRICGSLID